MGLVVWFLGRRDTPLGFFINQVLPPIGVTPESVPQLKEALDITNTVRDNLVRDWALIEISYKPPCSALNNRSPFSFASF